MTPPWPELQERIRSAAAGDHAAQDELVDACYPQVRAIAHRELEHDFRKRHRWILPLFSTQDVVHEVLAAVVRDLGDTAFDSPQAFHRYLATLVRHRLLDAVRFHEAGKRDARRQIANPTTGAEPVGHDTTPTLAAALSERAQVVRTALEGLPERHRRLLELRLIEGQTFGELAEALGYSSQETARQAFWAAQAKLLVRLRAQGLNTHNLEG